MVILAVCGSISYILANFSTFLSIFLPQHPTVVILEKGEPPISHSPPVNKIQTGLANSEKKKNPPSKPSQTTAQNNLALKPPIEVPPPTTRLDVFKSLLNKVSAFRGKTNVAVVIDSEQLESGFSPQTKLYNLFSGGRLNIIENLFNEKEFIDKGFFQEIYSGNTELLIKSDALRNIKYLLLGKISHSFKKQGQVDADLITCPINFSYKIIGQDGSIVSSDNIRIAGAGFTEDGAFERGLEMLVEQYFDKIFKSI